MFTLIKKARKHQYSLRQNKKKTLPKIQQSLSMANPIS